MLLCFGHHRTASLPNKTTHDGLYTKKIQLALRLFLFMLLLIFTKYNSNLQQHHYDEQVVGLLQFVVEDYDIVYAKEQGKENQIM